MTGNRAHLADAVAPAGTERRASPGLAAVFTLAVTLSACSIVYELLIAQALAMLAANTVVWYSLVIGTFLGAMGVGAYWSRRLGRRGPWRALLRLELGLTAIGALAVPLVHLGHMGYMTLGAEEHVGLGMASLYGTVAVLVSAIGVLTGAELPLLMRVARSEVDDAGVANLVLGLDYVGSLVGALAFPLVLLPNLPLPAIGFLVAVVNLGSAAYIVTWRAERPGRRTARLSIAGLAVGLVAALLHVEPIGQYLLKRYYYYQQLGDGWARFEPRDDLPDILRASSPYQKIDLVPDVQSDFSVALMPSYSRKLERHPDHPVGHILFLNGDFQTSTRYDEVYHEWFAHVPIVVNGRVPKDVLLLGGGDGFLLRELVKYDGIESITHVDIDATLIELARTNDVLRLANRDAFRDPRVETTIADGYRFVRESDRTFDAVFIDFPVAVDYDLAKLYSREFFHFVRERIDPGGFAVFDATGTSLVTTPNEDGVRWITPDNDWEVYYHTLRKAGFPTIVPYLTTLEQDNFAARERAAEQVVMQTGVKEALDRIEDEAAREVERERLLGEVVDQLMYAHVVSLEQGFVMVAPRARSYDLEWEDPGVELDILNARRFGLSFGVEFPMPDRIDPTKVNSILRPRFPTLPWWEARVPY